MPDPKQKLYAWKELRRQEKQEAAWLRKHKNRKEPLIHQKLDQKIPPKLKSTLNAAFVKAFSVVFQKGSGVIEKTYDKEELKQDYQVREYAAQLKNSRKGLRTFSRDAKKTGRKNFMISGGAGIGMGILGIGLPDILLFAGIAEKNIYEIALNYGCEYDSEEEKKFILMLIQGAVSYGEAAEAINQKIDDFIDSGEFAENMSLEEQITATAHQLSEELLYMKFLHGIPVIGVVGGAFDAVFMKRITDYAVLKYDRRFLKKHFTESVQ